MSKPTGKCIFCGKSGSLTKQHIIPDRLKRLVPRIEKTHVQEQFLIAGVPGEYSDLTEPTVRTLQGHVGNRRWRLVCGKRCNEGWIRDAETRAFSIITPLIVGETKFLSEADQESIQLMATTIICMADMDHAETSAISQEQRTFIYETKIPPPDWLLFVARHNSEDWKTRFLHFGLRRIVQTVIGPTPYEMQITTVGMGNLAFHGMSGIISSEIDLRTYMRELGIWPIHPVISGCDWSRMPILDTAAMDDVAHTLNIRLLGKREV